MYSNKLLQHKDLFSFISHQTCVIYEHYAKPLAMQHKKAAVL